MMDELIYRQDAIDALTTECSWTFYDEHGQLTPNGEEILGTLKKIPSAQKKGQWVENHDSDHAWKCSECGCGYTDSKLSFCYDCGADMRGEADGENS